MQYEETAITIMERLVLAIGWEKAVELCTLLGRKSLYIPNKIEKDHPLSIICKEKTEALQNEFKGETVEFPTLNNIANKTRRAHVITLAASGLNDAQILTVTGLSRRHIKRIKKQQEQLISGLRERIIKNNLKITNQKIKNN